MRRYASATRALWIATFLIGGISATAEPARAEKATLSLEELIQGMNGLKERWMSQQSWMVHYKHSRKPGLQQTKLPLFPDADVTNARKGPWLYVYDKQELLTEDAQH